MFNHTVIFLYLCKMEFVDVLIKMERLGSATIFLGGLIIVWRFAQSQTRKNAAIYEEQIKLMQTLLSKNQAATETYQKESNQVLREVSGLIKDSLNNHSSIVNHIKDSSQRIIDHIDLLTRNGNG